MQIEELRRGNDALRRCLCPPATGRPDDVVLLTRGVQDCPLLEEVLTKVSTFAAFTPDNDPHEEHDFGIVLVGGEKFMFKIDYYDQELKGGADPLRDAFRRVLTILRADEY